MPEARAKVRTNVIDDEITDVKTPEPECVHHWLIPDTSDDGQYPSTCKKCGAEKTFTPIVDESWGFQGFNDDNEFRKRKKELWIQSEETSYHMHNNWLAHEEENRAENWPKGTAWQGIKSQKADAEYDEEDAA